MNTKPETFASDATGFLIDLPGYGYAQAPEAEIQRWQANTQNFLLDRQNFGTLQRVYILIDARRGPSQTDRDIMGWFDEAEINYTIVVTKSDRVGRPQLVKTANEMCMRYTIQLLEEYGTQGPFIHLTSAKHGHGVPELRQAIHTDFLVE